MPLPLIYSSSRPGVRPTGAVYVGASSRWANPFAASAGTAQERIQARDRFLQYAQERVRDDSEWLDPLIGKPLICDCVAHTELPRRLRCHAEILRALANALPRRQAPLERPSQDTSAEC